MDELGSVCGALMATLVFVENSVGGVFRPPQSEAREEGGGVCFQPPGPRHKP